MFEGTIFSEGRGTSKPFFIFGMPNLEWELLSKIKDEFGVLEPDIKIAVKPVELPASVMDYENQKKLLIALADCL